MKRQKATQIGDLINQFLRQEGLESPLNEHRVLHAWKDVAGDVVNRHTGRMFIKNGVLYVEIKSAAVKSELMMRRSDLTRRLNEQVGAQVVQSIVII